MRNTHSPIQVKFIHVTKYHIHTFTCASSQVNLINSSLPNPSHLPCFVVGGLESHASFSSHPTPMSPHVQKQGLKDKFMLHHLIQFPPPSLSLIHVLIRKDKHPLVYKGHWEHYPRRGVTIKGSFCVRTNRNASAKGKYVLNFLLDYYVCMYDSQSSKLIAISHDVFPMKRLSTVAVCVCVQDVVWQTWCCNTDWWRTFRRQVSVPPPLSHTDKHTNTHTHNQNILTLSEKNRASVQSLNALMSQKRTFCYSTPMETAAWV